MRNFIRRFKSATHNTPIEYLQRVRIEVAKKVLENENCTLEEVMARIGYEDVKTFRLIFKRLTGLSPAITESGIRGYAPETTCRILFANMA